MIGAMKSELLGCRGGEMERRAVLSGLRTSNVVDGHAPTNFARDTGLFFGCHEIEQLGEVERGLHTKIYIYSGSSPRLFAYMWTKVMHEA